MRHGKDEPGFAEGDICNSILVSEFEFQFSELLKFAPVEAMALLQGLYEKRLLIEGRLSLTRHCQWFEVLTSV